MCATCGCGDTTDHGHEHASDHDREHAHAHHHAHDDLPHVHARQTSRTVKLEQDVLARNDGIAERNRVRLDGQGVVAWNLMSSPGAGKTTLLERTVRDLRTQLPIGVIEGDQATFRDAERMRAAGCPAVQINTGSARAPDAPMAAD